MRFTSVTVANSTLNTAPVFIPFLNTVSRHFDIWLSGSTPSDVYFNADENATTATTADAQLIPGIRYSYKSALGIPGIWVLAAGAAGNLNVTAY